MFWAYCPTGGHDLRNIDSVRMAVGVVQYFIRHSLQYQGGHKEEHVFAYIRWKKKHHHHDWFGVSATVCVNSYEAETCFCMLPIQRIACRCATILLPIDFSDIQETVFISCPIEINYSICSMK